MVTLCKRDWWFLLNRLRKVEITIGSTLRLAECFEFRQRMGSAWRTRTSMAASMMNLRRTTLSRSSNGKMLIETHVCQFLTNCRFLASLGMTIF